MSKSDGDQPFVWVADNAAKITLHTTDYFNNFYIKTDIILLKLSWDNRQKAYYNFTS